MGVGHPSTILDLAPNDCTSDRQEREWERRLALSHRVPASYQLSVGVSIRSCPFEKNDRCEKNRARKKSWLSSATSSYLYNTRTDIAEWGSISSVVSEPAFADVCNHALRPPCGEPREWVAGHRFCREVCSG